MSTCQPEIPLCPKCDTPLEAAEVVETITTKTSSKTKDKGKHLSCPTCGYVAKAAPVQPLRQDWRLG